MFFFFFQAEDGIRDIGVTGVQTCALPICNLCKKIISLHKLREHIWECSGISDDDDDILMKSPFEDSIDLTREETTSTYRAEQTTSTRSAEQRTST